MRYGKPPLSFPDQADLLLGRGLLGDRDELISRLEQVSHYRRSGYQKPMPAMVPPIPDPRFKDSFFLPNPIEPWMTWTTWMNCRGKDPCHPCDLWFLTK